MSEARLVLPSRPSSAGQARNWLASLLEPWQNETSRTSALLLMSEIVTNAIRHAHGRSVHVAVALAEGHLMARVHDDSFDRPIRRHAGESGGWGLRLLDVLAARWGVDQHDGDGKTVWFEIDDAALLGPGRTLD